MIKTVNIKDSYTFYRKYYKEGIPNCDYRNGIPVYIEIVNGFMKFIMKKVFDGFDVRLGAKLGTLMIRGKKVKPYIDKEGNIKGVAPNYGETKKLWAKDSKAKEEKTIIYCFNEHSNGIGYRLLWNKEGVIVKNKSMYGMSFSRANRREVNRLVVEENREYLILK